MIGPARPFVSIAVAGTPLGSLYGGGVRAFRYRDVLHGGVDDVEVAMADPDGLWRGVWAMEPGTEITATLGYSGVLGGSLSCGVYAVDEPESEGDGGGEVATFRGLAAFTSRELRTERSEGYDGMTLEAIVGRVAGRHGLEVVGPVPELSFERITQSKRSDLAFLLRLADEWGCYCTCRGDRLVFADRRAIEAQPTYRRFDLLPSGVGGSELITWQAAQASKGLYPRAELRYLHGPSKRTITAAETDPRIVSGDTLKLTDKVENQGQAARLCYARLARANDGFATGRLEMVGDPRMIAGQVVELGPAFGGHAGRWLIWESAHALDGSGYRTSIEIRKVP